MNGGLLPETVYESIILQKSNFGVKLFNSILLRLIVGQLLLHAANCPHGKWAGLRELDRENYAEEK